MAESATWKPCSACKQPIAFGALYYVCNVSTCNRKRTALRFCSVSCWEVHLPVARHREAWAEERKAPTEAEAARLAAAEAEPKPKKEAAPARSKASRPPRRIIPSSPPAQPKADSGAPQEVLIVASRLKDYVRAISGYNTSDRVLEPLSEIVREVVAKAIDNAREDGRKTVLDRDVPKSR